MRTFASAAALALAAALVASPAAHATSGPDIGVDTTKTGGVQGVYANGVGSITNTGDVTIPAGVGVDVMVHNMENMPHELHANTVTPHNIFALRAVPTGLMSWRVTTLKSLAPGETQKFSWTVHHYGTWHRVYHHVELQTMPGGLTDSDPSNNMDREDNGGVGL